MPNPRRRRDGGGDCFTCDAYGGLYPPQAKALVTICLRPADSGKDVSRMPEVGCYMWRMATQATPAEAPAPSDDTPPPPSP